MLLSCGMVGDVHPTFYLFSSSFFSFVLLLCCLASFCYGLQEDLHMWVLRKITGPEEMQASEHDRAGLFISLPCRFFTACQFSFHYSFTWPRACLRGPQIEWFNTANDSWFSYLEKSLKPLGMDFWAENYLSPFVKCRLDQRQLVYKLQKNE